MRSEISSVYMSLDLHLCVLQKETPPVCTSAWLVWTWSGLYETEPITYMSGKGHCQSQMTLCLSANLCSSTTWCRQENCFYLCFNDQGTKGDT